MKFLFGILILLVLTSCGAKEEKILSAQAVVDKSIEVSGGDLYRNSTVSFDFRDRHYIHETNSGARILKRITRLDTAVITDIKIADRFQRLVNGQPVVLPDSMARRYANSVNSVHYFAYLPYGLNDPAVNKRLLGKADLDGKRYYKVQVTFNEEGGGEDYDDVYVYWFNTETFKPDFLAYKFHVDGGGVRFRRAYNERYINGLRFVDYENYKFEKETSPAILDSLYSIGALELLSRIELKNIRVSQDNDN